MLRPLCLVGLTICALLTRAAEDDDWQRVCFREVDALFANPGQGWMSQQRNPNRGTRFPCSVAYIRFDWADVEPQKGQYNWKFIDDVISACKPRGAALAMRVMTANAHSGGYYSSPKWLFDAGCKGFEYNAGGGDPHQWPALASRHHGAFQEVPIPQRICSCHLDDINCPRPRSPIS
jgi:hypothetical protein